MSEQITENKVNPERESEIKEFVLGLLERQIDEYEQHKEELQGPKGQKMSEAVRNAQIENSEREIQLIRDAIKLFNLEEE